MDEIMRAFAIIATGLLLVLSTAAAPKAGQPWTAPAAGIEFVWVPSANLWASKYEVTNLEFRRFRPVHDSGSVLAFPLSRDRQPVVQVSYEDAVAFAQWMTDSDRAEGHIEADQYYRLPVPEEWSAMSGCDDGRSYPWGEAWPPEGANVADAATPISHPLNLLNYRDGHAVTSDVDESEGNEHGIHGMGGNVAEWVTEWYNSKRRRRTVRGGSWRMNKPTYMDCAFRNGFKPDFRTDSIGIRLVLGGPPPLEIDPRLVLGALGVLVLLVGGAYGLRFLRNQRCKPTGTSDLPVPNEALETPRPVERTERAAFATAPRQAPAHKSKTAILSAKPAPPPPEKTPTRTPTADSENAMRVVASMDETQERDKSIVASILAIRSQTQAGRDSAKDKGGKAPNLPKKRK